MVKRRAAFLSEIKLTGNYLIIYKKLELMIKVNCQHDWTIFVKAFTEGESNVEKTVVVGSFKCCRELWRKSSRSMAAE